MSKRVRDTSGLLTSRIRHSIRRAQKSLRSAELRKRSIVDLGEGILRSCRVAISSIHSGRMNEAGRTLGKSTKNFRRFLRLVGSTCYLRQWGYTVQVIQEFLEASLLFAVCTGKRLFPLNELDNIPDLAILYGVSDLIGELKRKILASLATEDVNGVVRLFDMMSELYGELSSISLADSVAPGFRRKLDVNRSILESTLSDITEEVGRRKLASSMDELAKRLQRNK